MPKPSDEAVGYSIFCDDIREEVNSKSTLVGIYGGEMLVAAQGPVIIPQLCFVGKLLFNPSKLPNSVSIILQRYDEVVQGEEMARVDLPPIADLPLPPKVKSYAPGEGKMQMQAAMKMSPLPVERNFTIRPVMIVDGVEKPLGSITVRLVEALPA